MAASGLSGDTLVACHFPLVPLPPWQLPVQALCSSTRRTGRLCQAGLTRAVSLPERDSLSREHAAFAVDRHRRPFSNSHGSLSEDRTEEEGGSDSSGRYDSASSPEESSGQRSRETSGTGGGGGRNSFLPWAEPEDEDGDVGSLDRYHEDSSFLLQGTCNWALGGQWTDGGTLLGPDEEPEWFSHQLDPLGDGAGAAPREDVSDSSCNSSDGVLVNFCAIYNRSNNPATPVDLGSPAPPPVSCQGSVLLCLQPVADPVEMEPNGWSPPSGLDSNCNLFPLEDLPPSCLSSLEASDLNACLRGPPTLPTGTNQKYYKLVSCDLSSQSPSPACSSHTSCPETLIRSPFLLTTTVDEGQTAVEQGDAVKEQDQTQEGLFSSAPCVSSPNPPKDAVQASTHPAAPLRPFQDGQERSITSERQSLLFDCGAEMGACCADPQAERYSRAQRPTSLPVQPFVLLPTRQEVQPLGCLLERYVSQKGSRSAASQPASKFQGRRSRCFSDLQLSPSGSRYPVFLEAPSSSDSCSTCSPSPEPPSRRHTWSQAGWSWGRGGDLRGRGSHPGGHHDSRGRRCDLGVGDLRRAQPRPVDSPQSCRSQTDQFFDQPGLVKIPTYQDLICLGPQPRPSEQPRPSDWPRSSYQPLSSQTPPTLPLSEHSHLPSPGSVWENRAQSPPPRAQPVVDSSFFPSGLTAVLSSVAPPLSSLTSLTSLLSLVGSHPSQASESSLLMSDKPPGEFCLSPNTSYESMSISHLQRRGLLRSVSRAVDLIMAHFGSSRDPYEKLRLGSSSRSPTIVGLVLEHLCPAVQRILEDGLRDHKLDLIIGQRQNHSWSVVVASATSGPSTRVLQSLVSKIRRCPQLSSNCMKLRAFIMGLLNLRALEFWLTHLQGQRDLVAAHYHSWGFLSKCQGSCQPLFEELLLTLQPLSVLPFDLNLLLEPRLRGSKQLSSEEEEDDDRSAGPPPPCSALLVNSWPLLRADREAEPSERHHQGGGDSQALAAIPEWLPAEADLVDDVFEADECSRNNADNWSQVSMCSGRGDEDPGSPDGPAENPAESPAQGRPRWAKLFGAAAASSRTETLCQSQSAAQGRRCNVRPSQWLHLDRSQIGLLAQSIRAIKLRAAETDRRH